MQNKGVYSSQIRISYRLVYSREEDCTSDFNTLEWEILERMVPMAIHVKKVRMVDKKWIEEEKKRYNEMIKYSISKDYYEEKLKNIEADNTTWYVCVFLVGMLNAKIDIKENRIAFRSEENSDEYEKLVDLIGEEKAVDFDYLNEDWSYIDDELESELRDYGRSVFYALILSNMVSVESTVGSMQISFNGIRYRDVKVVDRPYYTTRIKQYIAATKPSVIPFIKTWKWINNNTSLCGKKEASPVYFTCYTFLYNRTEYESLIYSVVGLESILVSNQKRFTGVFKSRLHALFPDVDLKEINKVYDLRSKFVHGEKSFSLYDSFVEFDDDESIQKATCLAKAMLEEIIRMLIANDAVSICFKETISYHFVGGV